MVEESYSPDDALRLDGPSRNGPSRNGPSRNGPSRTEDRILKNALRHFSDYGYTGTSVRDITAASEVTKPTLYYYFKNKEELFIKLATACFDLVIAKMKPVIEENSGLEEGINSLFDAYEDIFKEDPDALRFIYSIRMTPQMRIPQVNVAHFNIEVESYIAKLVAHATENEKISEAKSQSLLIILVALFDYHTSCLLAESQAHACLQTRKAVAALCACLNDCDTIL